MSAPRESLTELRFKGVPASPGIAIGPANLFRKATPSIDERAIEAGEVSAETDRLERSLARSRKELQKILTFAETKLGTEEAKIFEAQLNLAQLERIYRILSVFALGILLLAASYLYQRFAALVTPPHAPGPDAPASSEPGSNGEHPTV